MKRKSFQRIVTTWIGMMIILAITPGTISLAQPKTTIDPAVAAHILNTTVRIELYAPHPGTQLDGEGHLYVLAQGLGTLADWQGEAVLVTHNHWGSMLAEAEFVNVLDSQGNLLLDLSGTDFRTLIRYQDAGTLILTDPQCIRASCTSNLAEVGDSREVASGETVVFVHQTADGSLRLALFFARVVSPSQYKGLPVFKVRSLDGQPIISGDSGGGMWHDGKLVGNMWGRFTEKTGGAGYAARIPP